MGTASIREGVRRMRFSNLWDRTEAKELSQAAASDVCTENLSSGVMVMKSAKDEMRFDASGRLNRARDRRIFLQ
jgi:hypothetical protein